MDASRHHENGKSGYLCNRLNDFDEIWQGGESGTSATYWPFRLTEFENPRWRQPAILKNQKIMISQQPFD